MTIDSPARSTSPEALRGNASARLLACLTVAGDARDPIPVLSPFTGEVLGVIPRGTADDVQTALRQARAAQPAWASVPVQQRAATLLRLHDLLLQRTDDLLDIVQFEAGKARAHAFEEVADCANVARYYGVHGPAFLRPRRRQGAFPFLTAARECRRPHGVVAFIVPWNYPLNLLVTDALAALLAGNGVVLKPDHHTTFTALTAVELMWQAGFPRDLVTVVSGDGAELGRPLVQGADFAVFTGSTQTGRLVAGYAAEALRGVSLELGGKNPMIVLADADLRRAVEGAVRGCFVGAGQVCVSTERIYVEKPVFESFVSAFCTRTGSLRLSAALDFSGDVGSLMSARQLATVTRHVEDARTKGATVLVGGRHRPDIGPFFFEPTILAGVRPEMLAHREETFGPVVAVYPVESGEEAIQLANDSMYGLNASVWSRDVSRAVAMAERLQCGTVNVNEAYTATWGSVDAPTGGMKRSGIGRRHGREGLLKYTQAQTIAVQRLLPLGPTRRLAGERYARLLRQALKLRRHVPGLR